jgi:outer membrane protein insertion porin family
MKTTGFSVSLGKQLKWPDDYFSLIHTVSLTQYNMKNYPVFPGLDSGLSTNISYKLTLQRNSAGT